LPAPDWNSDGPDAAARDDVASKTNSVRLDVCPGLAEQLRKTGWRFWDGRMRPGFYWTLSRVGFNADHTQAALFVKDGWGLPVGDAGFWSWYHRAPGSTEWTPGAGGGGWIS
jgi:hypothetical protein